MMKKTQVLGIIRHALTLVGGMLIMKGGVSSGEWEEVSGYIIAAIGGIWSIIDKSKAKEE